MVQSGVEWGLGYEKDADDPRCFVLPRDVEWRKGLYPEEVFEHPAKMQLHIVKACVEYYERTGLLKPSARILDPFGGTGTTAIASSLGDYHVTLMELEPIFLTILTNLRKKWREEGVVDSEHLPLVMAGDCRQLMSMLPDESFDLVITSPPYANLKVGDVKTEFTGQLAEQKRQMHQYGSGGAGTLNFGRLNTFVFNQQMRVVYREVARLLKPGGAYVSVTKDQMRAGNRLRLGADIVRIVPESSGLEYVGHWWKWAPPGGMLQSVMKSKGSAVVEDEDIIEFVKSAK